MRHTQIEKGQRVLFNNSEASIVGVVTDTMDRRHTKFGRARYKFRVQWDTGATEWLEAGDLKRG